MKPPLEFVWSHHFHHRWGGGAGAHGRDWTPAEGLRALHPTTSITGGGAGGHGAGGTGLLPRASQPCTSPQLRVVSGGDLQPHTHTVSHKIQGLFATMKSVVFL